MCLCTAVFDVELYRAVLYCTVLYCTVLYCTVLYGGRGREYESATRSFLFFVAPSLFFPFYSSAA